MQNHSDSSTTQAESFIIMKDKHLCIRNEPNFSFAIIGFHMGSSIKVLYRYYRRNKISFNFVRRRCSDESIGVRRLFGRREIGTLNFFILEVLTFRYIGVLFVLHDIISSSRKRRTRLTAAMYSRSGNIVFTRMAMVAYMSAATSRGIAEPATSHRLTADSANVRP